MVEKDRKSIQNKGNSRAGEQMNGFCSQFCGQELLTGNNKTFTDLLFYGSHMAQYREHNRTSLSAYDINKIAASFKKQSFVSTSENNP